MVEFSLHSILLAEILVSLSFLVLLFFFGMLLKKLWAEKHPIWPLVLILLLAFFLRVAWISVTQTVPQSDFGEYWDYAHRFYKGDFYFDVIERHPGIIILYTLAMYLLGPSLMTGWALNIFFSLLLLLVLFKLTQELFSYKVGLLAMALAAILPQLVTYSALIASEIPAITYFLLVIWAALQFQSIKKHSWLYWASIGILLYGGVLVRSTALLLVGLIPIALFLVYRTQWKQLIPGFMAFILTTGFLLSTWITHQYLLTGIPKLFFGEELWLAYAVQYNHGGSIPSDQEQSSPHNKQTISSRLKSYAALKEQAIKVIRKDPIKYLQFGFVRMHGILWSQKSGILWTVKDSSVFPQSNNKTVRHLSEFSSTLWRILLILSPLGLLVWVWPSITLTEKSRAGQLVIWLFILIWLVFHYLIAVASERYGFQLIPFVLMLSSAGLANIQAHFSHWYNSKRLQP